MRGTIVRIGATGAGALLALALFPVSPVAADGSGRPNDRHGKVERSGKVTCFDGEGRTQGRSLSDPDGDSNRGPDKPGCNGGFDADKDGNNGCGNDADREDDNNGNCGRQKTQRPSNAGARQERGDETRVKQDEDSPALAASDVKVQAAGMLAAEASTTTATPAPAEVLGSSLTAPAPAEADTAASTTTPDTQVLGETLSAPDTLARTGAGVGGLALLGGLLLGGGRLTVLARRLLRIG